MADHHNYHTMSPLKRFLSRPAVLLVVGVIAWGLVAAVITVVVIQVMDRDESPAPDSDTSVVMVMEPTRTAAVATAIPSDTPTGTPAPTLTSFPTPTETLTAAPTSTLTPFPTPPPPTATGDGPVGPAATATSTLFPIQTVTPRGVAAQAAPADPGESTDPGDPGDPGVSGTSCAPPAGWERYVVQPDDTLFAFVLGTGASDSGEPVTVEAIMTANCLNSRYLQVDQVIYLPPGAADNAPPSSPYVPSGVAGQTGPRTPNCPCTITVQVGWRREQLADAITNSQTQFTGADFLAVTGPGASAPFDFVMERPVGASMEGFLFPGTYTAQNDTTAEQFRDVLLSTFGANVSAQMRADAAGQGLSFYQVLIVASIVQREVRTVELQPIVASIYYNRLRDGMQLGTTVSVQYMLGGPGSWWPRVRGSDLQVDSPYNTYNRAGLPPTPIDSPGLTAITAALYPAQTHYYFHTASCDGSGEVFAETYEQHLANVNCE